MTSRLSKTALVALLALLVGANTSPTVANQEPQSSNSAFDCLNTLRLETGEVDTVSDGDTIRLADGRRVRLIGFNTPELKDPNPALEALAKSARERLQKLLPENESVLLFVGKDSKDRHNRLLAHVIRARDGLAVASDLLESGYATHSAVYPNTVCARDYAIIEQQARQQKTGGWEHSSTFYKRGERHQQKKPRI